MLGPLTHAKASVRAKVVTHHLECIEIMRSTCSRDLKIWLPDGTNYPGQDSIMARQDRLAESLAEIYAALDADQRLTEASSTSTTVALVHGAFADAGSWAPVAGLLIDTGVTVQALSVPLRGLISDSAYVASANSLIPGQVLAVGHSGRDLRWLFWQAWDEIQPDM